MASIVPGRMTTADRTEPFVVFLIGMRLNRPLRIDKWWPAFRAMPRMIRELEANRDLGCLGAHLWLGRTIIALQYWESFAKLEAYAKANEHEHLPAWREFNRRIGASGEVGVWHETYVIQPGGHETIYVNMPPFGLGRIAPIVKAEGWREQAGRRLQRA